MRPIGIMSIPRSQTPAPERKFDHLMGACGHNTGNLLFTNAVWQQIQGPKIRIGYHFVPADLNTSLSALVIPAANWLGPHVDFAYLADLIEKLDIPVVLIGLGAQDETDSGRLEVPEGTLRFVRAVAERSHSLSVRGNYTRKILARNGLRNVTVTGCPSLYQDFRPDSRTLLRSAQQNGSGPTLLHSTHYTARHRPLIDTPSVHRELFRLAYSQRVDLLLQSEPEEISMITPATQKPVLDDEVKSMMTKLYDAPSWDALEAYLLSRARVFFDVNNWSEAMTHYGRAYGTRLHATIMALNSGVPAVLVTHDSRTRELAKFARVPSVNTNARLDEAGIEALVKSADVDGFLAARSTNTEVYRTFLAQNGLATTIGAPLSINT